MPSNCASPSRPRTSGDAWAGVVRGTVGGWGAGRGSAGRPGRSGRVPARSASAAVAAYGEPRPRLLNSSAGSRQDQCKHRRRARASQIPLGQLRPAPAPCALAERRESLGCQRSVSRPSSRAPKAHGSRPESRPRSTHPRNSAPFLAVARSRLQLATPDVGSPCGTRTDNPVVNRRSAPRPPPCRGPWAPSPGRPPGCFPCPLPYPFPHPRPRRPIASPASARWRGRRSRPAARQFWMPAPRSRRPPAAQVPGPLLLSTTGQPPLRYHHQSAIFFAAVRLT
jgi:hypothetical protein